MRLITKAAIAILTALLLIAVAVPAYVMSDTSTTTAQSTEDISALISPSANSYMDKNKLLYEATRTDSNVRNYVINTFGSEVTTASVGSAYKTMSLNPDRTWRVRITVSIPSGHTASLYDFLFNLAPIPGTFSPYQPDRVRSNYVEWDRLPAGTYTLQFDARQRYPGYVADRGYMITYRGWIPVGFTRTNLYVGYNRNLNPPTVTPTAIPTVTPTPVYGVDTTHRWAWYNGVNGPIEGFNVIPGTTVKQNVYYKNTGTVPDSYEISVSGLPPDWWTCNDPGSILLPGAGRYSDIFITPESGGGTILMSDYTFTVTVTSKGDPSVSDSETYTLHVGVSPTATPTPVPTLTIPPRPPTIPAIPRH